MFPSFIFYSIRDHADVVLRRHDREKGFLLGPVRKVTNNAPNKIIGKFPSRKSPISILWESQMERDCLYEFESDPTITSIAAQPFQIAYSLCGKSKKYTPDFFVLGPDRRDVVEVKPLYKTLTSEFRVWKATITEVLNREEKRFIVMTELDFRREPRLSNLKWLYLFLETTATATQLQKVTMLVGAGAKTIGEAQQQSLRLGIDPNAIWHLVSTQIVTVDMNQKLTVHSPISMRRTSPCQ